MKRIFLSLLALSLLPGMASAACYADYKAKRDNPLRLHYGVAEISGECRKDAARQELGARLARDQWQLLTIMTVFDETGLDERKDSAGQFFLRY